MAVLLLLTVGHADAALAATLFHFGIMKISELKAYLAKEGVPVRRIKVPLKDE